MASKQKDVYANRALVTLTLSAANAITFQQLNFAVGVFQGVALKLLQVEYHLTKSTLQEVITAADTIQFGVMLRDDLASIGPTNQSVLDRHEILLLADLTAESLYIPNPTVRDFTTLPGGGLLIPANPVFVGAITTGFAAAASMYIVIYYTFVQLSDREALELLQTIIPGNV